MGKRKIDNYKFIENKSYRNVTFCKRKNGIIKKAIEAGDGTRAFNMMREHSSAPAEYHELF